MASLERLVNNIQTNSIEGTAQKITGRSALVKDLFEFLFKNADFKYELLILCTNEGLILDCFSQSLNRDLSGYSIDLNKLRSYHDDIVFHDRLEGYYFITISHEESENVINQLQTNIKMLLSVYDVNMEHEHYLIGCLDSVENAICIYDKNACLLYGNKAYCDNMHVKNRDDVIGMNILDMTKQYGIKIHATKNNSDNLKMMDLLKNGKKILDWEVMIETETSTNKAQFVSNNMYPIKSSSGQVSGMVEVSYSHQLSLNKTMKLMGLNAEYTFDSIIGTSPAITEKIQQAKDYANNPYNLLIVGESGVGKELFAQSVHNYSDRRNEAFVALNCASFPENLIESELFGYVGGAFTGASKNGQIGKFDLADGGTLFLDEIGELPYHFQSKLLRVLETSKITRIGSTSETPVNVRVIAATNRDLVKMISEGLFREDLYYRLQVLNIEIPPLRQRREDLLVLTDAFFAQAAEATGSEPKILAPDAKDCIMKYDWPGNVRELRNVIHRVSILSKTEIVTKATIEAAIYSKGFSLKPAVIDAEETPEDRLSKCRDAVNSSYVDLIKAALDVSKGNKSKAADLLGVSRKTFYRMIEKYR